MENIRGVSRHLTWEMVFNSTILNRLNGKLRPPLPPKLNDGKRARYGLRTASCSFGPLFTDFDTIQTDEVKVQLCFSCLAIVLFIRNYSVERQVRELELKATVNYPAGYQNTANKDNPPGKTASLCIHGMSKISVTSEPGHRESGEEVEPEDIREKKGTPETEKGDSLPVSGSC
ncbi:uncharacterized protein [Montipora foliosa]|uniref:uncharacterized protein n=1 Tax=Montipora foliosa TaxID=591990 RepID=UPI0035F11D92